MLLTLDIAFRNVGWVLIHDKKILKCGVISTEKTKTKGVRVTNDDFDCASKISYELSQIIFNNDVKAIIGELPTGSQNAKAGRLMGMASGIVAALSTLYEIPVEWATPDEVKKATVGRSNASKEQIMDAVCEKFGWEKEVGQTKKRVQVSFHVLGKTFNKGQFEHIADAVGAYMALKQDNLVRMFG